MRDFEKEIKVFGISEEDYPEYNEEDMSQHMFKELSFYQPGSVSYSDSSQPFKIPEDKS